jgi:protein-disulfide isomerase
LNKKITIAIIAMLSIALVITVIGASYNPSKNTHQPDTVTPVAETLVRSHSPTVGPRNAPVTIVEFLDPACETCRAFYPIVKQLLTLYPNEVRLVIRYAAFHKGSDDVIRILETARRQQKYDEVLEALFKNQEAWASHDAPNIEKVMQIAIAAGLDHDRAAQELSIPEINDVLEQDAKDVVANNITKTPSFFVNGKPLVVVAVPQLYDLVNEEVLERRSAGKPPSQ